MSPNLLEQHGWILSPSGSYYLSRDATPTRIVIMPTERPRNAWRLGITHAQQMQWIDTAYADPVTAALDGLRSIGAYRQYRRLRRASTNPKGDKSCQKPS